MFVEILLLHQKGALTESTQMDRPVDKMLSVISLSNDVCLHFIDVENIAGSGLLTVEGVKSLCTRYVLQSHAKPSDLFFVAAGPQNATAVREGWKAGQTFYQFRKGKDGADLALVNFYQNIEHVEAYKGIFVASGDHSLEPIAQGSARRGVPVTVVTGKGGLSRVFEGYDHLSVRGF